MKHLIHPVNAPRLLDRRFGLPVVNPTPEWSNFSTNGKKEVKDVLMPAQKYLCSYCEIELNDGAGEIGYHIEHIEPKSGFKNRTFDFHNLLVSCFTTGNEVLASSYDLQPISCGHAKLDVFDVQLFIKPTNVNCEKYFFYELDGRIVHNPELVRASEIRQAKYTISTLNLNCRRLRREREDMIKVGLEVVSQLLDSSDALYNFADLELAETNNKHKSFITTRRQYFQDFR